MAQRGRWVAQALGVARLRGFTSTVISLLLDRLESMSRVYLMSTRPPRSPREEVRSLVNTPTDRVP